MRRGGALAGVWEAWMPSPPPICVHGVGVRERSGSDRPKELRDPIQVRVASAEDRPTQRVLVDEKRRRVHLVGRARPRLPQVERDPAGRRQRAQARERPRSEVLARQRAALLEDDELRCGDEGEDDDQAGLRPSTQAMA